MLLVVVASQLPVLFSLLAFGPRAWIGGLSGVTPTALGYLAFQLFAASAAGLAENERRAREELVRAKGRLEALQERLTETTREAERLRIARELHDALGHQLTARALASSLMASVRDAVTELREESRPDLALGLHALRRPGGQPRVDVECDAMTGPVPHPVRLALIRVAQEIVTNTAKHAHAATLRLSLSNAEHAWILRGEDDGAGTARVCTGHGLSGMRDH